MTKFHKIMQNTFVDLLKICFLPVSWAAEVLGLGTTLELPDLHIFLK